MLEHRVFNRILELLLFRIVPFALKLPSHDFHTTRFSLRSHFDNAQNLSSTLELVKKMLEKLLSGAGVLL